MSTVVINEQSKDDKRLRERSSTSKAMDECCQCCQCYTGLSKGCFGGLGRGTRRNIVLRSARNTERKVSPSLLGINVLFLCLHTVLISSFSRETAACRESSETCFYFHGETNQALQDLHLH